MPAPQFGICISKDHDPFIKKVMNINIKDPVTGEMINCEAMAAENESEQGWSVLLPKGSSIFITEQQGEWKVRHDDTVHPDLAGLLGKEITDSSIYKQQHWEAPDDPEKTEDHRENERLLREKNIE